MCQPGTRQWHTCPQELILTSALFPKEHMKPAGEVQVSKALRPVALTWLHHAPWQEHNPWPCMGAQHFLSEERKLSCGPQEQGLGRPVQTVCQLPQFQEHHTPFAL